MDGRWLLLPSRYFVCGELLSVHHRSCSSTSIVRAQPFVGPLLFVCSLRGRVHEETSDPSMKRESFRKLSVLRTKILIIAQKKNRYFSKDIVIHFFGNTTLVGHTVKVFLSSPCTL